MSIDPQSLTVAGLTEYSSTTSEQQKKQEPASLVPKEFLLPDGTPDYLRLIITSRVYEVIKETPVTHGINLSARIGYKALLKREDLQPVFSFKVRGAYNKMANLPVEDRWKGVIACSAGNHAQGVAFSAKHLGIPATIVMPLATPNIKHENVSRLGSKVVLHGNDFDAAKEECKRLSEKFGITNIPPFDDPFVIAGQGTIAMELVRQCAISDVEAVFCCIGGGGLIAGIGSFLKRIAPHIKIIGVETYDANAMVASLGAGKIVQLNEVGLFADGAAVKVVGDETFRLCQQYVDEIIQVNTDEICAAIKDVFLGLCNIFTQKFWRRNLQIADTRSIVEPAGALAVAGMKKYAEKNPAKRPSSSLCAVLSGANMDFDRLRFVAERARLGEGVEALLSVVVPDRPKVFYEMMQCILPRMVTEFSYRFGCKERAVILMSILVKNRAAEIPEILEDMAKKGFAAVDVSDNEFAKSHGRYLVGGRLPVDGGEERIYRFEFPERPGALQKFLELLRPEYNISCFHYRNQGGASLDVGKVLAGIQVPAGKREGLESFLNELRYPYIDETDNPVYRNFMLPVSSDSK
ncbi:threonine deaminase [Rhizina undulata]